jgi:hypothetical protein
MQTQNANTRARCLEEQKDDQPWIGIERGHLLRDLVPASEDANADELDGEFPARQEKRERVFRVAEYSPYPRVGRDQRRLNAFVRNESTSGMCLVSDQSEPVGCCLQVGLQGVDGFPTRNALARVVWTRPQTNGRHWMGLSLVEPESTSRREAIRSYAQRNGSGPNHPPRSGSK